MGSGVPNGEAPGVWGGGELEFGFEFSAADVAEDVNDSGSGCAAGKYQVGPTVFVEIHRFCMAMIGGCWNGRFYDGQKRARSGSREKRNLGICSSSDDKYVRFSIGVEVR